MKIKNNTVNSIIVLGDLMNNETHQYGVTLPPAQTMIIFDEDAEKSSQLATYITGGEILKLSDEEPTDLELRNIYISPARPTGAYSNIYLIDGDQNAVFTGGVNQKTYGLFVNARRPLGSGATLDSNDAVVKGSYNNYAVNDANFIIRGMNFSASNRAGGVTGMLDNLLGCSGKSGGTVTRIVGLTVSTENFGTVSGVYGGIDIQLKNEGAVATEEYGLKIENINNSLGTAVGSAILVSDTGANIGFTTGLNLNGATLVNQIVLSNGIKLTVSGDIITFTDAGGTKSSILSLATTPPSAHVQNTDTGTTVASFIVNSGSATNKLTLTTSGLSANVSLDANDISDAITKKHTAGTDAGLDTGGTNPVTAASIKTALDTTIPAKLDASKLVAVVSGTSTGGTGVTETLTVAGLAAGDTILFVCNSTVGATPANCIVNAFSYASPGNLSVTWIGDPGAGAKVTVCLKKA